MSDRTRSAAGSAAGRLRAFARGAGAAQRRLGAHLGRRRPVEGAGGALFGGALELGRGRALRWDRSGLVEVLLLVVEQILAQVAATLGAVELLLVGVAPRLRPVELGLAATEADRLRGGLGAAALGVQLALLAIQTLLLAVAHGLLAVSDGLVEVGQSLLAL
jgi:hypothetical protein